jgi:hypothetical protein
MREDDPEAYASEVMGQFRAGIASLLDPEAIARCVATDRLELPPVSGIHFSAFLDVSGGRSDAFCCAIGHRDGERAVVDVLRAWNAPFNPTGVVAECADLLRAYRVQRPVGDRFAAEWPVEAFRAHGINYQVADRPKSDFYLALVAHVNAARIELPDDPKLLRELRMLERRRGPSGKDRVDHPKGSGSHDDRANVVAGLASELLAGSRGLTPAMLYSKGGTYDRSGGEDENEPAAEPGWSGIRGDERLAHADRWIASRLRNS